jgi:hypothetical protein
VVLAEVVPWWRTIENEDDERKQRKEGGKSWQR